MHNWQSLEKKRVRRKFFTSIDCCFKYVRSQRFHKDLDEMDCIMQILSHTTYLPRPSEISEKNLST